MKNKLFLTSMLVMLTATPAFAVTDTATTLGLNADDSGQIGSDSTAENCYGNALTFEDAVATSGTVTYTANWTPQQCTITLNTDAYNATTNSSGRGDTGTSVTPSTLYTIYDNGAYLSSNDRTAAMALIAGGQTDTYVMTAHPANTSSGGTHPLTSVVATPSSPVGKEVTLTLNTNLPANYIGDVTQSTNYTPSTSDNLIFNGFYSVAGSGGTQYIGKDGYILSDGVAVAKGLSQTQTYTDPRTGVESKVCPDTTWYAQYACADVGSYTPTLDSHDFVGWYDTNAQTGGNAVNDTCINSDTTAYARWTPKQFTLTYNSGTCSGNGSTDTLTFNASYDIKSISQAGVSVPTGYTFQGWTTNSAATSAGTWQTTTSATPTDSCNNSGGCSNLGPWRRAQGLTLYAVCTGNGANIIYNCGTANGTTITGPTVSSTSVTIGVDYVLEDSNNCSAPGYEFIGWSCPNLGGTPDTPAVAGGQLTLYSGGWDSTDYNEVFTYTGGSITCTAQWRSKRIYLEWYLDVANTQSYNNPQSCAFGVANDISPLTEPTKTGYTFTGWTVTDWSE